MQELETSVGELMIGLLRLVNIVKNVVAHGLKVSELPEDEDDVMVIECALTADAQYLVSGDPHLLHLKEVRGIKVLTPTEFLQSLNTELVD